MYGIPEAGRVLHELVPSKITALGFSIRSFVDCLYQEQEPYGSTSHLLFFTDDLLGQNSNGDYSIIQEHYAELRKDLTATDPVNLNNCKFLNILFQQSDKDGPWHAKEKYGIVYASLVGCLLFLLRTREDIRCSVTFVAMHSANPNESHYKALLHLWSYVLET
ncbi:hypothetical protein TrST_g3921 [Triparma strigata]|uniref:Uncharacterized protein n=1 Tax=Triparma strigata TaxID=1606541 RepID=A0A9W7AML7_9STRA|nr:hypothetical protein TrST_g3921 [Triparma strigata]